MPPLDQRYVTRLDDFTKALEGIVELLKQDTKKKNVDSVNKMLSNMNDNLNSVVKNMEIVVKSTKKIESQNDKILEEIRASKKAKETGMFGDVAEVDNKRKILDAVKVVVLIAAGVLAIGLAFKIIGVVNFLSVVAIGLAIVFIAGAFVLVAAATEGMTMGDVTNTTGLMVVMAMGLTVSSWILALAATTTFGKAISIIFTATALGASLAIMANAVEKSKLKPVDYAKMMLLPLILPLIAIGIAVSSIILSRVVPMTFAQAMSTVFVATAVGTSLYIMAKSLEKTKIEAKDIGKFIMLAVMLPAMALGLVVSSIILKGVATLSFGQAVSAIFTAVTIGVLVYLMKPLIEKMKDLSLSQILRVTGLIVAIAVGLVIASHVLGMMHFFSFKESLQLIMSSLAIGLAVLFLTPAIYVLKSIKTDDMIQAGKNIVIASATIMLSSWLLNLGTYDNMPDLQWTVGAGSSIIVFAGTIWLINKMKMSPTEMLIGGIAILGISAIIMLTSWILSIGNYDEYPDIGWAAGVGLTLISFGGSMYLIGKYLKDPTTMLIGAAVILGVAVTIMLTSIILNAGNYDDFPDVEWSAGVGLSLIVFGGSMAIIGSIMLESLGLGFAALGLGAAAVLIVSLTIVAASYILGMGSYDEYPDVDWAKGVGLSLISFGLTMGVLALISPLIALGTLPMFWTALTVVGVSKILASGDYSNGPTLDWSLGTGAILLAVGMSSIIFAALLPFILLGGWSMKKVAETIVEVAAILSKGDFSGGPTEAWAKGVGGAIQAFAVGLAALAESDSLFGSLFGQDQGDKIIGIANAMVVANQALSSVSWSNNYPSEGWAKGVGGSIMAFAKGMAALAEADIDPGLEFMFYVSTLCSGIIMAANILNEFEWNKIKNYPSEEWAKGVGNAINAFAGPLTEYEKEAGFFSDDLVTSIKKLAKGLVAAAEIIGNYDWSKIKPGNYPSVDWTSNVGRALEVFVKSLVEIEKNDVGSGDVRNLKKTIKAIIAAAEGLGGVDVELWKKGPTSKWSENVGMILGTFVKYLIEIEKADIGSGDIRNLKKTIKAIVTAAEQLGKVESELWKKGPTSTWSDNVGKALGAFVKYLIEIEKADIGSGDIRNLKKTIKSIITAAEGLGKVESELWKKGPTSTWSDNIGKAIGAFVKYLIEIEKNDVDITNIDEIIKTMIKAAKDLGNVDADVWKKGPPASWGEGIEKTISAFTNAIKMASETGDFDAMDDVGDAIISFARKMTSLEKNKDIFVKGGIFDTFSDSMKKLSESLPNATGMADGLNSLGDALLKISSMGTSTGESIKLLAESMIAFGESLKNVDMSAFDKLSKFSSGILVLSLIDEKKLEDAISIIDKKRNDIKSMLSDNETVKSKSLIGGETKVEGAEVGGSETSKENFYAELLKRVKSLDENVILIAKKEPSTTEAIQSNNVENAPGKPVAGIGSNQTNPNTNTQVGAA